MGVKIVAWLMVLVGGIQAQGLNWGADPNDEWNVFPIAGQDNTAWEVKTVAQTGPPGVMFAGGWVEVDAGASPPVIRFSTPDCAGGDGKTFEVPLFRLVFSTTNAAMAKAAPDSKPNPLAITETNGNGIAFNHEYWDSAFNNSHIYAGLGLASSHYTLLHELAHVAFEQHVEDNELSDCQDCIGGGQGGSSATGEASCSEAYAYAVSAASLCAQANQTDSNGDYVLDSNHRSSFQAKADFSNSKCETSSAECATKSAECNCSLGQPCPHTDGCPGPCELN